MPEVVVIEGEKMLQFSREEIEAVFTRVGYNKELAASLTNAVMGSHDKIAFSKVTVEFEKRNPVFQMVNFAQENFLDLVKKEVIRA